MPAFCCFAARDMREGPQIGGAGWSSPVARQAHNLKVVGSNPTPATNNHFKNDYKLCLRGCKRARGQTSGARRGLARWFCDCQSFARPQAFICEFDDQESAGHYVHIWQMWRV